MDIYWSAYSGSNGPAASCNLADAAQGGGSIPVSGHCSVVVLLPLCHRLYPQPLDYGTCGVGQDAECCEDHLAVTVIIERSILAGMASAEKLSEEKK